MQNVDAVAPQLLGSHVQWVLSGLNEGALDAILDVAHRMPNFQPQVPERIKNAINYFGEMRQRSSPGDVEREHDLGTDDGKCRRGLARREESREPGDGVLRRGIDADCRDDGRFRRDLDGVARAGRLILRVPGRKLYGERQILVERGDRTGLHDAGHGAGLNRAVGRPRRGERRVRHDRDRKARLVTEGHREGHRRGGIRCERARRVKLDHRRADESTPARIVLRAAAL